MPRARKAKNNSRRDSTPEQDPFSRAFQRALGATGDARKFAKMKALVLRIGHLHFDMDILLSAQSPQRWKRLKQYAINVHPCFLDPECMELTLDYLEHYFSGNICRRWRKARDSLCMKKEGNQQKGCQSTDNTHGTDKTLRHAAVDGTSTNAGAGVRKQCVKKGLRVEKGILTQEVDDSRAFISYYNVKVKTPPVLLCHEDLPEEGTLMTNAVVDAFSPNTTVERRDTHSKWLPDMEVCVLNMNIRHIRETQNVSLAPPPQAKDQESAEASVLAQAPEPTPKSPSASPRTVNHQPTSQNGARQPAPRYLPFRFVSWTRTPPPYSLPHYLVAISSCINYAGMYNSLMASSRPASQRQSSSILTNEAEPPSSQLTASSGPTSVIASSNPASSQPQPASAPSETMDDVKLASSQLTASSNIASSQPRSTFLQSTPPISEAEPQLTAASVFASSQGQVKPPSPSLKSPTISSVSRSSRRFRPYFPKPSRIHREDGDNKAKTDRSLMASSQPEPPLVQDAPAVDDMTSTNSELAASNCFASSQVSSRGPVVPCAPKHLAAVDTCISMSHASQNIQAYSPTGAITRDDPDSHIRSSCAPTPTEGSISDRFPYIYRRPCPSEVSKFLQMTKPPAPHLEQTLLDLGIFSEDRLRGFARWPRIKVHALFEQWVREGEWTRPDARVVEDGIFALM